MVERLMGLAHVLRTEAGGHRLDTLPFPWQQQSRAIRLQGNDAIQVPRGLRQAIEISREAFLLGAWRNRVGAHKVQRNTIKVRAASDLPQEDDFRTFLLTGTFSDSIFQLITA